jgi:glycine C-acetyltransferase
MAISRLCPNLVEVAKKYDILFMVDDAHGEGVLGKGGRGIVDHFGLHGQVDIEVGTMSKAFGVVGGMVAGDNRSIIEWLRQRGRPFLFSSAVTAPDAAACLAAVDLLEESTELVDKLWDNAKYFKAEMKKSRVRYRRQRNTDHTRDARRSAARATIQP